MTIRRQARLFSERLAWGCVVAALLLCIELSGAQAQGPADQAAYDTAIAQAVSAHEAGRYLEAREHFQQAHALFPNARSLRGMGVSAFEAGEFVLAVRDLQAALNHPERPLDPELRRSVVALIADAMTHIGTVRFALTPEAAKVTIDGEPPLFTEQGEVLLDAGAHRLVVEYPQHVAQTLDLNVVAGQHNGVTIALAPELKPLPQASLPTLAVRPPPTIAAMRRFPPKGVEDAARRPMLRPWAGVSTAAAGLSFISALTVYGIGRARVKDIVRACESMPEQTCTSAEASAERAERHIDRLDRTVLATTITGAAFAVTAVALFVTSARLRGSRKTAIAPIPWQWSF